MNRGVVTSAADLGGGKWIVSIRTASGSHQLKASDRAGGRAQYLMGKRVAFTSTGGALLMIRQA